MKKFSSLLCLLFLLSCIPLVHGSVVITAPDGFAVACNTNYSRITPHFCLYKGSSADTWTITQANSGVCTTTALTTVPTSATAVRIQIQTDIASTNVVNNKTVLTAIYTGAACGGISTVLTSVVAHEWVLLAVGTRFVLDNTVNDSPIVAGSVISRATFTNCLVASNVFFTVIGYYD